MTGDHTHDNGMRGKPSNHWGLFDTLKKEKEKEKNYNKT